MIPCRSVHAPIAAIALASLLLAGCAQRASEGGARTLEERYASLGVPSPKLAFDPSARVSNVSDRGVRAPGPVRRLVPSLRGFVAERLVRRDVGRTREIHVVLRSERPGSSENYLDAVSSDVENELLSVDGKPTETSVRQELAREFLGIRMHVVTAQRYNAYGPYGLALGVTSDGERCAYAWQWTDLKRVSPTVLRSRICTPKLSLDDLAARFDRIALDVTNPVSQAARPRPRVSRRAASGAQPVVTTARVVPDMPTSTTDGRRYLVAPVTTLDRVVPRPPADVAGPTPTSMISLPPEALRGPEPTAVKPSVSTDAPARAALRS